MLQVGVWVMVLAPFAEFFPGQWLIESINPDTGAFQIADGIDFDAIYLELVES